MCDQPVAANGAISARARWLAPSRRRYSARSGPVALSWPEALELLSAELGEPVTCKVAPGRQFLDRLTGAGIPAGTAELLITREWAILAGENDYTTGTSAQVTGRPRARWPSSSTSTARNSPDARASPSRPARGRLSR